jgi:hypothetical protein
LLRGPASVSGLVLVVPPVEVVVEQDDTTRRHAGYDAPRRGQPRGSVELRLIHDVLLLRPYIKSVIIV